MSVSRSDSGAFPHAAQLTTSDEVGEHVGGDLLAVIAQTEFRAARDILLVSGSIVAGLANLRSDLDLYIINWSPHETVRRNRQILLPSRRVDVNYLQRAKVEAAYSCIESVVGRDDVASWADGGPLSMRDLDLYYRSAIGVRVNRPIVPAHDWPRFSLRSACLAVAIRGLRIARGRHSDAVGAFESRQNGQSAYAAATGLRYGLAAYAALMGEPNPSEKWLGANLSRMRSDPLGVRTSLAEVSVGLDGAGDPERLIAFSARLIYHVSSALASGEFREYPSGPHPPLCRYETRPTGECVLQGAGDLAAPGAHDGAVLGLPAISLRTPIKSSS